MTIIIDDAGVGDLLFGVIIGGFREETREFKYEVLDVKYFRPRRFRRKDYLKQASRAVFRLVTKLGLQAEEQIHICKGYIFDEAVRDLGRSYGSDRIRRVKVTGEPQRLTENAYLDEVRNLGYEPLRKRDENRAKSFFHMMNWLQKNPDKLRYAKTGWPRLSRYRLFRLNPQARLREDRERKG
ncbi:MAG: hypothetical protein JSV57_02130 [Candidatus Bathyarchaeota archaeon]|nr:MAG: hypothetical protein JSV57_02130 [Candidatus Bathyarchaeota archaeon]